MQSARDALRGAQWTLDERVYGAGKLSLAAAAEAVALIAGLDRPFYVLVVDKDEVTLIAPLDWINDAAQRSAGLETGDTHFRLITLEVEFALEVVGIMAAITPALAEAGIPILAVSAFSRDHFLVPDRLAGEAMSVLRALAAK
ncbi:MAG: ACT domain-containing protein [Anaerolineae bacterium]|nr:ACT domain-containing protein [Anaerolineae bacterium]